jgi:hypothetical protein
MLQTMRVKRLIRFGNKSLEILDRIELAKIAGFDPAYIEEPGKFKLRINLRDPSQAAPESRYAHPQGGKRVLTSLSHCTAMRRVPRP